MIAGSPEEAQQLQAEREAKLASPEAVAAREASASAYEGFSATAAESVANEAFKSLIDVPAGGPPSLPTGERIGGFPSDYAMQVQGGGGRLVLESLQPVAIEVSSGQRTPIDLSLGQAGGAFGPRTALAPVRIPRHLDEAPALQDSGVSLTPVDEQGSPLNGAEGVIDGTSVFYGDSEDAQVGVKDMDTIVKPWTFGLMLETVLRSQRSPEKLFFRVGMPESATLTSGGEGPGSAQVVDAGQTIAVISTPGAHDAEGTPVPVSMVVSGDTLVLTVAARPGGYRYPVVVDPRVGSLWDQQLNKSGSHPTNWHFKSEGSGFTGSENSEGKGWTEQSATNHAEHGFGAMEYTTQGLSHIWDFASETSQFDKAGSHVETRVELLAKGGVEREQTLAPEFNETGKWNSALECLMKETCKIAAETNNTASYVMLSSGAGTGVAGENVLHKAEVAIEQEVNPEVAFDTTDPTLTGGVPNALYGTKNWLGPHSGALVRFIASDKGIGVEDWSTEHSNAEGVKYEALGTKSMMTEGLCSGVQCPSEVVEFIGYSSALPDGEPTLGLNDWNALPESHASEHESEALRRHKVRVDSTPPHNIAVSGLPTNNEVGAGEYQLKAEAADGSGTTPSSGVKSLALLIDGRELGSVSGSCEPGPCTAHSNAWTIAGRSYATGKHVLTVVATDNAGNTAGESFTMTVHQPSPVGMGPGR